MTPKTDPEIAPKAIRLLLILLFIGSFPHPRISRGGPKFRKYLCAESVTSAPASVFAFGDLDGFQGNPVSAALPKSGRVAQGRLSS